MTKLLKMLTAIMLLTSVVGCGSTRVVFVDTQSDLVRIGPNVTGRIYTMVNGQWVLSKNKVELPEGWYAGGIPKED